MMSLSTIHAMAQEAAAVASRAKRKPFFPWPEDLRGWQAQVDAGQLPTLPFPFLGDYIPEGFVLEEKVFVDSSGWGAEDEPAMTIPALVRTLRTDRAYAITEAGQFQVYIGVYRRAS